MYFSLGAVDENARGRQQWMWLKTKNGDAIDNSVENTNIRKLTDAGVGQVLTAKNDGTYAGKESKISNSADRRIDRRGKRFCCSFTFPACAITPGTPLDLFYLLFFHLLIVRLAKPISTTRTCALPQQCICSARVRHCVSVTAIRSVLCSMLLATKDFLLVADINVAWLLHPFCMQSLPMRTNSL